MNVFRLAIGAHDHGHHHIPAADRPGGDGVQSQRRCSAQDLFEGTKGSFSHQAESSRGGAGPGGLADELGIAPAQRHRHRQAFALGRLFDRHDLGPLAPFYCYIPGGYLHYRDRAPVDVCAEPGHCQ